MLLAMGAAVLLQATDPAASGMIVRPIWVRRPKAEDLARVFPDDAQRLGLEGRATVLCRINRDGRTEACAVASEEPAGGGFGSAAIALAPLFVMRRVDADGVTVEGRSIRIPVTFRLPWAVVAEARLAAPSGPGGEVRLNCRLTPERRFDDCVVVMGSRDLADYALAVAAKSVAPPLSNGGSKRAPLHFSFTPAPSGAQRANPQP